MTTNKLNFKTLPSSVDYLNDSVLGVDPETKVLSRLYESDEPLQDRVTNLEADQVDLRETAIRLEQLAEAAEAVVEGKLDPIVLTNLVSNGDLTMAKPSPNQNEPLGFTYTTATDITLINGIAKFTATALWGRLNCTFVGSTGDKMYVFSRYKTDSLYARLTIPDVSATSFHTGSNNFELVSAIYTLAASRQLQISDARSASWTPIEVDYIGAINLTAIFGAGNEPTKKVMDATLGYTGFFQSKKLNLMDIFIIFSKAGA